MNSNRVNTGHPDTNQLAIDEVLLAQKNWRQQHPEHFTVPARRRRLRTLLQLIEASRHELCEALGQDLGRPPAESVMCELLAVKAEAKYTLRKLKSWAKGSYIFPSLLMLFTHSRQCFEAKGQVLILSPWNYPVALTLRPLISAIAAGNSVVVKPSEHSSATMVLLCHLLATAFDHREVYCASGGPEVAGYLVSQKFDHIFFTGSMPIAKKIAEASAPNLVTLTLELGGKCPVLVDGDANFKDAAEKITWGRFINAGQTCLAPDYVLVPKGKRLEFITALKTSVQKYYGKPASLKANYGRIINRHHHDRLTALLKESEAFGDEVIVLGNIDREEHFLGPTVVLCRSIDSPLMKDEIFGPILVLLCYDDIENALEIMRTCAAPLCTYGFTSKPSKLKSYLCQVPAGSTVINDVVSHFAHTKLPFGGVGGSGTGRSHGRYGFEAFSNVRAVSQAIVFSPVKLLYPPYNKQKRWLINFLNRYL